MIQENSKSLPLQTRAPEAGRDEPGLPGQSNTTSRRPATKQAILLVVGVVTTISALTFWQQGSVAAIRGVVQMIQPVGLVWLGLLFAIGAYAASRRYVAACVAAIGFVVWTLVGTHPLLETAARLIEPPLVSDPDPAFERRDWARPFDTVVLLGGGSQTVMPGFAETICDGERVVSAAQAWHAGIVRSFIVTGSSTLGENHPRDEARYLLTSLGVPGDRIFAIEGVNTRAEMRSLRQFLDDPPIEFATLVEPPIDDAGGPTRRLNVGLITSAFHIPRSLRLAVKEELELQPLPCAYRVNASRVGWSPTDVIPNAVSLANLGLMFKELLAQLGGQ